MFIFNKAVIDAVKTVNKDPFEPIFEKGVHHGPIKSVALCPTKQLFASLADDSTLKIWEFGNDFKEVFSRFFHDSPQCIAIHPLSVQIALGFYEGIRFYYYLEEDLKLAYTQSSNIKACTSLQYSDGGNLLAAANGQNINVYDPYTFNIITTLTGHSGSIKDIQWHDRDKKLLTTCSYGFVFLWSAKFTGENEHREFDLIFRNPRAYAITYDAEYDITVVCCDDGKTRIMIEKAGNTYQEYDSSPVHHTAVCISKKHSVIYFGTNLGSIRVYLWPFTEILKDALEYIEFPVH
jgi:WD40 repeat protein